MIGNAMMAAWQYVLEHEGCSKTEVTDRAHLAGEPPVDMRSVNSAIHCGLIIPDRLESGRFSLRAHTFTTMPEPTAVKVAAWYTRHGATIPPQLAERFGHIIPVSTVDNPIT